MTFEDWRDVPGGEVAPLYEAERTRWLSTLGWDLAPSWRIVEEARAAGRVPGLVARHADGRPAGWTFYVLHDGILQVGGLAGDSAGVVRRLLDRVLQSPEARLARGFSCFLFPATPSLQSALERQRFLLGRHLYLSRALIDEIDVRPPEPDLGVRLSGQFDPADLGRLLARAYAGRPEARCFAPDARLDQWAHYVGQLLATPAVGCYLPSASFVVERKDGRHPIALVLTTALSRDTAHIAQIVVDPANRRSGLARHLVEAACNAARAAGHCRLTLLVAEGNDAARALYARCGFEQTAHFVHATRPALTRRVNVPTARRAVGATD